MSKDLGGAVERTRQDGYRLSTRRCQQNQPFEAMGAKRKKERKKKENKLLRIIRFGNNKSEIILVSYNLPEGTAEPSCADGCL